jgi:glutaminase
MLAVKGVINRAMCYYMKQYDIFEGDVEEVMDLYTKQCAIKCHHKRLADSRHIFFNDLLPGFRMLAVKGEYAADVLLHEAV